MDTNARFLFFFSSSLGGLPRRSHLCAQQTGGVNKETVIFSDRDVVAAGALVGDMNVLST